jgi:hypothetical protein
MTPTILYEDNATCISHMKEGYIKGDRTKGISPEFFYSHDLIKDGEIKVEKIRSRENLADLFINSLPTKGFEPLVRKIGLRRLRNEGLNEGEE